MWVRSSRIWLTVDPWWLRLSICERVMRGSWRRIQARRTLRLHVTRHTRLALLFLRRWSKTRPALPASGHDALEQVRRTMADSRWWWLGWTAMRALRCAAALLELVPQARNLLFVPAVRQ